MDRHRTEANLPGFFELVDRGQADSGAGPDFPDTRPMDGFPTTEWLPMEQERWTE